MNANLARQCILAAASGLLYPLSFPDFSFPWLAWIVLVPLHLAIDGVPVARAWWLGWMAGTVAFFGTMAWVVTAMHRYGQMPLAPSYGALVLLALYLGLYVALYATGFRSISRLSPIAAWLAAPPLWVALELIRTYLFSGLPWALLGYSQAGVLPIIQFADMTGVYGISFLIVLVNAAIAQPLVWLAGRHAGAAEVRLRPQIRSFPWLMPAVAAVVAAAALLYGHAQLAAAPATGDPIRVSLVQPNIDQAHKWDRAFAQDTVDRYVRLTTSVAAGSDLVIWPEAATPFLFELEEDYRAQIAALTARTGVPLVFGSPALRRSQNGRPYLLNSAYLFSADGQILGRYDKRHLVPFGEYIPLKSFLFFLEKLVVGIGDFEAGTVPTVLRIPARNAGAGTPPTFGVVICFEVIFPDLVREFVREGAEFMVTITNDAWFGESAAPYQHFGMVVLRSVENRIAFARAANTGISGLIDPYGRVLAATPIFTEQALAGAIPRGRGPTFYSMHGDVFAYACTLLAGLVIVTAVATRRRGA